MRLIPCEPGSDAWVNARLGIPTASCFDKILTAGGKLSAQRHEYMYRLLAERITGFPATADASAWMGRGKEMEAEAVAFFEMDRNMDTTGGGVCLRDDGRAGCSPDRLVGADEGLEIKCPAAHTHIGYLLGESADKYRVQVQGSLWVTGRSRWWWLSYCPGMPPALVPHERDEAFIAKLAEAVEEFANDLEAAHQRLLEMGVGAKRGAA